MSRYPPSMSTATSQEAVRLAAELKKRLGDGPLTARELAERLVATDNPAALIAAFDDALARAAAANPRRCGRARRSRPPPDDARLAEARRVAQRAQQEALSAVMADALTRQEAAELLGISPQAVSKRHAAGALVALTRGRELHFPAWQFHEGATLPRLAGVIAAYPGGALSLSTWAVTPTADLDALAPAHALARRGGPQRVLAVIDAIGTAAW